MIPTFGDTEAAKQALLPEYRAVRSLKSSREHVLHIDRPVITKHDGLDLVLLPMERAEASLRDWLTETRQTPGVEDRLEEGLALLRQAGRGVAALHAAGLVHMDLKPENLLLSPNRDVGDEAPTEWTVKVADFGLARSLREGEVLNREVVAEGVGTPLYMAPEQIFAARQKDVGPKADIYSLGVMLFELLDGDRPFDGTGEAVRRKHQEVEPPAIATGAPQSLKDLAQACLRKDPEERPASIEAVAEQLALDGPARAEEPTTGRIGTPEARGEAVPDRAAEEAQAPAAEPDVETEPEEGNDYIGTVKSIRDFGAFVEIMPEKTGLLHASEISHDYVEDVKNHLEVNDKVKVRLLEVRHDGKLRLTRKLFAFSSVVSRTLSAIRCTRSPRKP